MATNSQTTFSNAFYTSQVWYFDSSFTEIYSQKSDWQYVNIVSVDGLAPSRRQSIIWTNDDQVHWGIYATLEGDELSQMPIDPKMILLALVVAHQVPPRNETSLLRKLQSTLYVANIKGCCIQN